MKFRADPKIFETFPEVKLGVVVGLGVDNSKKLPEISKLLSEWQIKQKDAFKEVDLPSHERIKPWRQAYSKFGSKPSKYNSSIESLLKRVVSGGSLPSINSLVDLYNAMSLKHVLPFGAEDLDKTQGDIKLAFAEGTELGKYIGSDAVDTCEKGEVAYLDDLGFICRRWNWREADRTKITKETQNFVLVIEVLPPVTSEELQESVDDFVNFASKFLGGQYQKFLIDSKDQEVGVDFQTGLKVTGGDITNLQISKTEELKEKVEFKKIEEPKLYLGNARIIFDSLKETTDIENIDIDLPENEEFGDYSSNVAMAIFSNAKFKMQSSKFKNSRELAEEILEELQGDKELFKIVEKIEVAGPGFINFWLKKDVLVDNLIHIDSQKEKYGFSKINEEELAIVEYSSPNIAKPFTIGHLRSTIIGDAIANLLEATGWKVLRDNHLGDWGTQFGKQIYAIKTWGSEKELEKSDNPIRELVGLYVKFHSEAEKNPKIEDQARSWFKKLEDGNPEARNLWEKCVNWSWKEFEKIYKKLNVNFSPEFNQGRGLGESFFEDKMGPVISELEKKGLLRVGENGAKLVFFEKDKYPPLMILKKDGATLYATRDLATDKYRKEKYDPSLVINEVGSEQSLYWKQIFEIEENLSWYKSGQRVHIGHGLIRFKEGKMSTRKGNVIWLEDVLGEAIKRAKKLGSDSEELAEIVGIGALKYNDLKRDPNTEVIFDWDEILNMEGNSGPYLQYTVARTNSVLAKSTNLQIYKSTNELELNSEELLILRTLVRFQDTIMSAAKNYSPNILCNYLFDLAQKYNGFYNKHRILADSGKGIMDSEKKTQKFRILLTKATGQVLKNGLTLLGIETPERM